MSNGEALYMINYIKTMLIRWVIARLRAKIDRLVIKAEKAQQKLTDKQNQLRDEHEDFY